MSGVGPQNPRTFKVAAPSNYVAGVGRGAMGFTTRSDIGPARPAISPTEGQGDPQFGQAPVGYVAGRGRGMGELAKGQGELSEKQNQQEVDRGDYSESNYDEFSGYGEKLFTSGTPYGEDDAEADNIYDSVDDFMEGRRKRKREQQLLDDQKNKNRTERPKIADQFADLKRELATVTADQWDAIPDIGDNTLKMKQKSRKEIYTPLPDYLLDSNSALSRSVVNGVETPMQAANGNISGTQTVTGLAEARGTSLSLKLDKMSDSVSGQTVVDPKGYLTDLNSLKITSDAEVGDIKKARTLLSSVTSTNPKHGPGWIASARVEEFAGKLVQARKIIRQGCETVPESEDVWLEAARLHATENAKTILANAVRHLPTSVKIWLQATELEHSDAQKKIVLRRALEFIPNSVKLWKTAIELEDVSDARIMLARAVECVPHNVEMWLALAKLETHENARKVLNQAREAIPTEPATWITAAKLEEAHGNGHLVERIVEKMLASLAQYQVVINRDQWLKEAELAEQSGAIQTCISLVRNTIQIGVEEEDRKATWMDDADSCLTHTSAPIAKETARAIYAHALSVFPTKKSLWLAAAMLEKEHGTPESLETMLKDAVRHCPEAEIMWLMAAKEKWMSGNVPGAREILLEAFVANPESEQIWLAAAKLEWESNEYQRARVLLSKARDRAPSERVWMKSALLEAEQANFAQTLLILDEGIVKYPTFAKFYMMAGQTCMEVSQGVKGSGDAVRARDYYQKGIKQCPTSIPLWRLVIRLEESVRGVNKARSMMELARLKMPLSDEVWLESIRLERRAGNEKMAESLMAKALQDCPASGLLWAEEITTCNKAQQKSKSVEALKRCDNDHFVIMAVAQLFEKDRKVPKARKWFDRAVALSPRLGDAWAHYYAFELRQAAAVTAAPASSSSSSDSTQPLSLSEVVLSRCVASEPNRGELWCAVSKSMEFRRAEVSVVLKKVVERMILGSSPTFSVENEVPQP